MVHLVGGNFSVPVGRQGARATRVNVNVNERTFVGGSTGFYGGSYGIPDYCSGNHDQKWTLGDTFLGLLSAGAGFLQGYSGSKQDVKTDIATTEQNTKAFEDAMKKNKQLLEERKEQHQKLVDEIAALKAASTTQQTPETTPAPETPATTEEAAAPEETITPTSVGQPSEAEQTARAEVEAKAKAKAEAEALKKEGITKNSNGTYSKEFTDIFGNKIKLEANSVKDIRAQFADAEKNKATDKSICDSFGIKPLPNGRFSYPFYVDNNGQQELHTIEFSSLDTIETVIEEAERIKNR